MKIYLAQGFPEGWGGLKLTSQSVSPHLINRENTKLRLLLSYWYYKNCDLDALFEKYFVKPYPDILADSGAFSAMTQGVNITAEEYGEWLKKWKHLFSVYSNLDVIRDGAGTLRNQKKLEDMGLNPMPVFHVAEEWEWLEKYIDSYNYIALGVAGMTRNSASVMAWVTKCFKMAGSKSVYHGFALTSWQTMSSFPWYSVDSSTWGSGFRFGRIQIFNEQQGKFNQVMLGDRESCTKYAHLIRKFGFDPLDFYDRSRNDRAKICAISAVSFMVAERWLRKRWGEIKIPLQETNGNEGLRLHLATWPPEIKSGANSKFVGGDIQWDALSEIKEKCDNDPGIKIHLADANIDNLAKGNEGIKVYLSETTMSNTRPGDINSAMEILSE